MSKQLILRKAEELWVEYVQAVGADHVLTCGIDFDEVYDAVIYPRYGITLVTNKDLGFDDFGEPILGKFLPADNTALIDNKLFETQDPRRVFTEWHEVAGHGVLQGRFLQKVASKNQKLFTTPKGISLMENAFNTFEWQANAFAANVAAPKRYVQCIYIKLFGTQRKIRYCGPRWYSLIFNDMLWYVYAGSPMNLAWKIAKRIRHYFWGLSIETIAYQVLDVVVDQNGYNRGELWPSEPVPKFADALYESTQTY
jgi:hypothetical protein